MKILVIPVWYTITDIIIIVMSSMIIKNKYDTDTCYDGIYINETMHDLFVANMILYLILTIAQTLSHVAVCMNIVREKNGWLFFGNIVCFIGLALLNGMYLNFILTNANNCFKNFKSSNIYIYVYFIITFAFACICQLILLIRLSCFAILE